ncbi:MAG: hypothetical protein EZS28_053696, partial [Streblomastix strix]
MYKFRSKKELGTDIDQTVQQSSSSSSSSAQTSSPPPEFAVTLESLFQTPQLITTQPTQPIPQPPIQIQPPIWITPAVDQQFKPPIEGPF